MLVSRALEQLFVNNWSRFRALRVTSVNCVCIVVHKITTHWMLMCISGDSLQISSMYAGDFRVSRVDSVSRCVLFAAGTGFTPMAAILRHCYSEKRNADRWVFDESHLLYNYIIGVARKADKRLTWLQLVRQTWYCPLIEINVKMLSIYHQVHDRLANDSLCLLGKLLNGNC